MATKKAAAPIEDSVYHKVAEAIADAGFLLIAAGAGFSADSGLPVYKDVARLPAYEAHGLNYSDLCDPEMQEQNSPLFDGFWGSCYNSYLETTPHEGYSIISNWRIQLFGEDSKSAAALRKAADQPKKVARKGILPKSAFFVYTSNVDGHFRRFFPPQEVLEIHGSTDYWQCTTPCSTEVWTLPSTYRFNIDPDSLKAVPDVQCPPNFEEIRVTDHYISKHRTTAPKKPSIAENIPACIHCGGSARPNVLMFNDGNALTDAFSEGYYVDWECAMENVLNEQLLDLPANQSSKDRSTFLPGGLVIIEMGCGKNVPSVRRETEMVLADINRKAAPYGVSQCLLVRINPDFPNADNRKNSNVADHIISIHGTALTALRQIDMHLQKILQQRQ